MLTRELTRRDGRGYGSQPPGVSITDACIDWDTTEKSLRSMHAKLKDVLPKRPRG
jgi:3-deoxy-7-phosphoheptulonate synthase